jgi:hypothetical protein
MVGLEKKFGEDAGYPTLTKLLNLILLFLYSKFAFSLQATNYHQQMQTH